MDPMPVPKSLEHLLEKRSRTNRRKGERRRADSDAHDGPERRKGNRRKTLRRKGS